MKLSELVGGIDGIDGIDLNGSFQDMEVFSVCCDSRNVMMGSVFVALNGTHQNGEDFIHDAVKKNVFAVVLKGDCRRWREQYNHVCFLSMDDPKNFLRHAVKKFYGTHPGKVKTIGITGTNGKTTVSYLIEAMLSGMKQDCGVVGTINYRLGFNIIPARQTTPSFVDNHRFLTGLMWQHVPYCVMEVSSHALTQDRVDDIDFHSAVFTNLTSDHLDYHQTMENYFAAKSCLFTGLKPDSTAILNEDDAHARQLRLMTKAKVITYGIKQQADVRAEGIHFDISGSRFTLVVKTGKIKIRTRLIGLHNVYNILAAVAVGLAEGFELKKIRKGIERLVFVPGRLERVNVRSKCAIFIDYAHTQDALENVLAAIREVSSARVILVFGCGGDRDKSKRSVMGKTAARLADKVIVTTDNPRSEDPTSIIAQIIDGNNPGDFQVVVDRKEAIRQAINMAGKNDLVLIAGKGHETYQVLADRKIDFDERAIVREIISSKKESFFNT